MITPSQLYDVLVWLSIPFFILFFGGIIVLAKIANTLNKLESHIERANRE